MKVLKSNEFSSSDSLADFVNYNGIQREDILNIVVHSAMPPSGVFVIYYYGDPNIKEKTKSLFGWK
ncbi:MAG: hypothetical protein ACTHMI_24385 [Mucilaginibacter sp.]